MTITDSTTHGRRNESLDLLRGLAILMVVAVHTSQSAHGYFAFTDRIAYYGQYGVQLFFMISGYTMMLTFGDKVTFNSTVSFYIRRFFRIVPLFWVIAAMYLLRRGFHPNFFAPDGVSISDALLTLGMVQWLSPTAFNSVVPGGWSIAVEMQFYVIFPLFAYLFIREKGHAVAPYAIAALVYAIGALAAQYIFIPAMAAHYPDSQKYLVDTFFFFWLPNQLICFGLGFALFEIIERKRIPILGLSMLIACCLTSEFGRIVLLGFVVSLLVLTFGIKNSVMAALGRHSYSIYLVHFDFAGLPGRLPKSLTLYGELAYPIVVAISFAVSKYITDPLIEDRFIKLGKTLSRRYRTKTENPDAVLVK